MKSYQQFFAELKRRKVFKVAAVYGAVAFVLLQVAELLGEGLRLPESFLPFITAVVLLGFPLALILAWAFEVTPEGVQRTDTATPGEIESIVSLPASKRWPAGLLALAGLGALLSGAWWVGTRMGSADARAAGALAESAPRVDSLQLALADPEEDQRPAIAVLPFADMSPEGDQQYFSDGITEEILNTLVKVRELKLAARTSALAFRDRDLDMRAIGDSLGVSYLIEGSVRKAGAQLRITAQLIDANDGTHLWSESYDRTMDDVFAIQTEIAQAIATELRVPLGLDADDLVNPTTDLEAYDLYLAGRGRMRERYGALSEAIRFFEAAIARDSTWAPAWAGLAEALELIGWYDSAWDKIPDTVEESNVLTEQFWRRSEWAARRALELDPEIASAHVALGSVFRNRREWRESEEAYLRALAKDPENPEAYQQYADMLAGMGRIREGLRAAEWAVRLDPAPVRIVWHGNVLEADDRIAESREVVLDGLAKYPTYADLHTSYLRLLVLYGDPDDGNGPVPAVVDSLGLVAAQIRSGHLRGDRLVGFGLEYPLVLMARGARDSAIARLPDLAEDSQAIPFLVWLPIFDPLRDEPAYFETLRLLNLEGAVPQRTPR